MVVVAEDGKHAERKARWSSDDFKKAVGIVVEKNKFRPRKNCIDSKHGSLRMRLMHEKFRRK